MLLAVLLSVIPSMTCCQEAKFLIHNLFCTTVLRDSGFSGNTTKRTVFFGASPSGKASVFGTDIPRFES